MTNTLAVSATKVTRRFGYRPVIRELSLDVMAGQTLMLVGHNGSGKTTLLRLLAGLLSPTTGTVERRGAAGYVAHHAMMYEALTAHENLAFFARLHGTYTPERIRHLLAQLGLAAHADRRIGTYSRGMLQRLALARALLGDPKILLLDEPLTGLDDAAAVTFRSLLTQLQAQRCTIVVASHQLMELVDLVSHVGFLVDGRLRALEEVAGRGASELMARYRELQATE